MRQTNATKKHGREVSKAISKIKSTMQELDVEKGPCEWCNVRRFLDVSEWELAVESIEWAIIKQDLLSSKKADDALNDAKRILGLFRESRRTPYLGPNPDLYSPPRLTDIGVNQ